LSHQKDKQIELSDAAYGRLKTKKEENLTKYAWYI